MVDPSRFAGRSPRAVLLDRIFWTRNPRLVLALVVSLLTGAVLVAVLVSERGILPAVPALAIYLLVFWGTGIGASAVARLQVEHGIAQTVSSRAATWLRKISAGEVPRPDLEQVEPELIPSNPASDIGIVRLFQHIVKEAKDRKSSPGFLIMQPYREESYSELFRLQGVQRAALQLGILGTFVGLVMALTRLRPGGGGGFEIGEIGLLITSLDVAFTTSIAGIAVSVVLGFVMQIVRGKQEAYFRSMEEATVSVASLARNAINKDEYLAELNQVQVAIDQLGDRILEQSQQTEAQTGVIRTGIRRLVETKGELDGFLSRLGEEQTTFVDEMKEVYQHLSPRRLAERLDERIEAAMDRMLERWDLGIDSSVGSLSEMGGSLREVIQGLESARDTVLVERGHFQKSAERSSAAIEGLSVSLERISEQQVKRLNELQRAVPDNLDKILEDAVRRAVDGVVGAEEREPATGSRSEAVPSRPDELTATLRTVGEIQHTTLLRIASEVSLLRESMERRLRGRRLADFRRWTATWLRWELRQTAADFRSIGLSLLRWLGRSGRKEFGGIAEKEA